MGLNIYILFAVAFYCGTIDGSPTQVVHVEDNNSDDCSDKVELFSELKGLIEESRDAVITHIDEQLDLLKEEIKLSEEKELLLAEHGNKNDNEIKGEEDAEVDDVVEDICHPNGEEPVCGEFGECIPSDSGDNFTCWCEYGYYGQTCQLVDHCAGTACLNGGECTHRVDGFECQCQDGWTGERCQELTQLPSFSDQRH